MTRSNGEQLPKEQLRARRKARLTRSKKRKLMLSPVDVALSDQGQNEESRLSGADEQLAAMAACQQQHELAFAAKGSRKRKATPVTASTAITRVPVTIHSGTLSSHIMAIRPNKVRHAASITRSVNVVARAKLLLASACLARYITRKTSPPRPGMKLFVTCPAMEAQVTAPIDIGPAARSNTDQRNPRRNVAKHATRQHTRTYSQRARATVARSSFHLTPRNARIRRAAARRAARTLNHSEDLRLPTPSLSCIDLPAAGSEIDSLLFHH